MYLLYAYFFSKKKSENHVIHSVFIDSERAFNMSEKRDASKVLLCAANVSNVLLPLRSSHFAEEGCMCLDHSVLSKKQILCAANVISVSKNWRERIAAARS